MTCDRLVSTRGHRAVLQLSFVETREPRNTVVIGKAKCNHGACPVAEVVRLLEESTDSAVFGDYGPVPAG